MPWTGESLEFKDGNLQKCSFGGALIGQRCVSLKSTEAFVCSQGIGGLMPYPEATTCQVLILLLLLGGPAPLLHVYYKLPAIPWSSFGGPADSTLTALEQGVMGGVWRG